MEKYLLLLLFLPTLIYADSNSIWNFAENIRGGIFGLDEQPISNYTFQNNVYFLNSTNFNSNIGIKISTPQATLDVNGSIYSRYEIKDLDSDYIAINKKYFDMKINQVREKVS